MARITRRQKNFHDLHQLAEAVPKQSFSITGAPMEPINLIVVGSLSQINRRFFGHGWYLADSIGPLSLSKALMAVVFNTPYSKGPFSPSYINGRKFLLGMQHPTQSNTLRRRHHIRLWKTSFRFRGQRVWVGTASYDRASGLSSSGIPTHHISPGLVWEEMFLSKSLGLTKPQFVTVAPPSSGRLSNGDHYIHDGKAIVLDLTAAT